MNPIGGGDITVPPTVTTAPTVAPTTTATLVCSTCAQATVITGSGVGVDQPITQISGTDANGCRTVTVTCTSPNAGQTVNFFWYDNNVDRGTSSAPTTITRTLVCNANGALILTENGASAVVNQVECISAPVTPVCTTCPAQVAVIMGSGIGKDETITQTPGTDANGCSTIAVTCTAAVAGTEIFYFWKQAGADRGSSTGTTTITRNLVCNDMAQFVLTEPDTGAMGIVDQVECVSASVCTTCPAQVAVIMGSGIGKDETITQTPGTDANGCSTLAVTCTAAVPGTEVSYFWKLAGADRGSSSATTTITRTLTCNDLGQFVLTEPDTGAMGIVDQVECVSPLVCTTCAAQVTVITGSGIGKDEAITQTPGMDANGCNTLAVTCTAAVPGTEVSYFWKLAGADRGSSSAITTITRNLVCNDMAQFVLTESDTGAMGIVDQVECVSPLVCTTCAAQVTVITGSGIGKDETITQTPGMDANGCNTIAVTCTAAVAGTEVSYFWKLAGADRGSSSATTTITRNLVCNDMAQFVLTEPDTGAMGIVDQVECVSPLVCSTCAAQLTEVTGSGLGKDEPITQTPGMNANGCDTLTVTCTAETAGREIIVFWSLAGADRGSSMATTTLTRNLVCNDMGLFLLTDPDTGAMATVDSVECVSVIPLCETCTQIAVTTGSGIGTDRTITQTPGKDANNCNTLTVSCASPVMGEDIFLFWANNGAEIGNSQEVMTISRTLTCNDNGEFLLTDNGGSAEVDQVQCVTGM